MTSGRWLRIAPDDSSTPLQTMSYWNALMSSGSCVSSASRPPCGIENGLWEKSIFFSSSFHSYIGKSTIQQNSNTSVLAESELRCRCGCARRPRVSRPASSLSAGEEHRVAGLDAGLGGDGGSAPRAGRNLAIGPLPASAPSLLLEDDIAEARRAFAARPVVELVEEASAAARRRRAPGWRARVLPLEGLERHVVAREHLASRRRSRCGLRRSGLSMPYFSIASAIGDARERLASPACRRRTPRTRRAAPARPRRTRRPA